MGGIYVKLKLGLLFAVAISIAAVAGLTAAPNAQAQPTIGVLNAPCTITMGTLDTADDLAGTFTGTFEPVRLVVQQGTLAVRGILDGVCTATSDPTITEEVDNLLVNVPILGTAPASACQILDLTLGPLNLDLLGLVVDLSQVDLDITAVPGAGNLLGNLLCAVAGLLDGGLNLDAVVRLLNRLLGQGLLIFS
jgi:hypothetical protein